MRITGVFIADLHIGAIPTEEMEEQIEECLLDPIMELATPDPLDFIMILGDYWDGKMTLSSDDASLGVWLMGKLRKYAKLVRVIYGTESHEVNQYNIFDTTYDRSFRVIRTVEEEELFEDFHVLYLPEEYLLSKDEYYKEYFSKNKYYDLILGHGVLGEAMEKAAEISKEKKEKRLKPPTFTFGDFKKCCKGQIVFGHYHVHTEINPKMCYVGSFTRWQHGEEEDKGFLYYERDEDFKVTNRFIVNPMAKVYKTYRFGYDHEFFTDNATAPQWIESLKRILTLPGNEEAKIRVIINIPEDFKDPEFFMNSLRQAMKFEERLSLEFTNGYIDKKRKVNQEALKATESKFDYVFDKNLSVGEILHTYIAQQKGKDIPAEEITQYLHTDVTKLISDELDEENRKS